MFLAIAWLSATAASLIVSYQAGCAGDTKGATLGDVHLALELEDLAFGLSVLAFILLIALLLNTLRVCSWAIRLFVTVVTVVVMYVGTIMLAIEIESAGIRNCF